ncbi:MAG: RNA signal recognition particle [Halioglobus sp.]|nr:RNA signal recognition particle [Halioglobus sp.]|tara:strand:- start:9168 stop:9539 length:372 start_codon:yes stop_codon:yes gene_type:complete
MSYIDGIILAVPKANKEQFIQHAGIADAAFIEWGATRVLECWEDDVPDGKITDFRRAVQATQDEAVVFSWVEWPDKATRDAGMQKLMSAGESDPRFSAEKNPMPFDGMRMIFGGFVPVLTLEK